MITLRDVELGVICRLGFLELLHDVRKMPVKI